MQCLSLQATPPEMAVVILDPRLAAPVSEEDPN